MDFAIGGITAALVFGIVEFAKKQFKIQDKACQFLALSLGFLFVGTSQAISQGVIPAEYVPYIEWFVISIAGTLAPMGYYSFAKKMNGK